MKKVRNSLTWFSQHREGLSGKDLNKVKGSGGGVSRKERFQSSVCAQRGSKCREHFSREAQVGPAEKAYGFLHKFCHLKIWRQERGRVAARAVKPAWPPCWPSSMIESRTLAMKSE